MNCAACAHANPEGARFCNACGGKLEAKCASCGAQNPPGARFCSGCGRGFASGTSIGSAGASPSQRPATEPRSYTPKHLADKILASKSALEGERKQVTVLFADVKGSMELAEQVDPEDWHRILNRFFEILTDGVHRFEGTVNQYTGDGIMALFGAPITHEDHAHRACFTALHLQDELRRYAEEIKRTRGLNFSVRMGINSGEVVVGKIGDDLRMDYTAQGHTVGLASRLEQLAESGKAYVSDDTARIVSGYFALRDLGTFELKGVGRPLRVHELEGVGEIRTRLDVSRARGLSRFVGRADEMDTLDRALARVQEGHAQVVGVVAAAGTGKSRLCHEFIEKCKAQGLRVREAHGVPHGKSVPFLPVFEFLRGFFGVTDRDTDEDARKRIAGTLLLLDKDLTEALPVLFEFLGIADPNDPSPRMDPDARQRQLFALTRRILHARNRVETGLILVEDMHWMDGGSEVFLEQLVEALPGTRTLLLVNFRPEYQPGWLQKSFYQQIALHPLGPAEISELLQHLLGNHPSLGDLPDRIRERTAGNPYFIEEIIRSLEETGSLQGARGAYRLAAAVGNISIPASVQAVLGARIDRLAEREKRVLQTAAVIGKEFAEPVLKQVADLPEPDLAEALRALTAAEYIFEESIYPALEYAFTHPLTQDVAYRSQLADRRSRVHGDVARALVDLHRDKLDERAALIAHHFENAGEALEAARWHQRAAEWAGVRDPAEALRHWRSVRSLLERLPESPETVGLGQMACIRILGFGFRMGMDEEEFTRVFDEGVALAKRAGNSHALTLMLNLRNAMNATSGRIDRLMKDLPETLRAVNETGDPGLELSVKSALIYGLIGAGRLREAIEHVESVLANPPDDPLIGIDLIGVSPFIQTYWLGAFTLAYLGRPSEALDMFHRCIALAEKHGQTELAGWARGIVTLVAFLTGDGRGALEAARLSVAIAEKMGNTLSLVTAGWSLGTAHIVRGEWNEAGAALERALELARRTQAGRYMEPRVLAYLSEVHLQRGENEKALEAARDALTISREGGMRSFECASQVALARALMAVEGAGARQAVEASLSEALRISEETDTRYWRPFIEERRAQLAGLLGDEAGRRRALEEARRLFSEMDATVNAERIANELEG